MTQKELAALCGCSQATVSKALRGASDISADMREKILTAAGKCGISAERGKPASGQTVLVLTPEYSSEFYTTILSFLSRSLWDHGFEILSTTYEWNILNLARLPNLIRPIRGLCGIMNLSTLHYGVLDKLAQTGIPIIGYGTRKYDAVGDAVRLMIYKGIRDAVLHLIENGRRRIAFVGEENSKGKENSFRQVMAELSMPADNRYIYRSGLRLAQAGADGFEALFSLDEPPDAILCAYDYIALGVLNAAYAAEIEVPQQLAVIGMDNIRAAETYRMGLTTISADYQKLSDMMVELLIRRIREPDAPRLRMETDYQLIVRETG